MAARTAAPSLTAFAEAQPNPKAKCRLCTLPPDVLRQVNDSAGAVAATVVAKWLNEHHKMQLNPNGEQVRRHLQQHKR